MDICVGQLWESPDTGNRWRVKALCLGHVEGSGKVHVLREPSPGAKLPKWEDGKYTFPAGAFRSMRQVE